MADSTATNIEPRILILLPPSRFSRRDAAHFVRRSEEILSARNTTFTRPLAPRSREKIDAFGIASLDVQRERAMLPRQRRMRVPANHVVTAARISRLARTFQRKRGTREIGTAELKQDL